jgi:hypothetical protein
MSVRTKAWVTHIVITFALLTAAGTWAIETARNDTSYLQLGRAIGFMGFAAVVLYAILATGAVAAWGRRPGSVLVLHVVCSAVSALFVITTCVGVR